MKYTVTLAIVNKMRDNEEIVLTADNYVDYGLKIENVK